MKLVVPILVIAAIGTGSWLSSYRSILNPAVQAAGLEANEKSAGASLMGQFRTSAAASLFARADLYMHGGVELRPMTGGEEQRGAKGSNLKKGEAPVLGDESRLVTAVPGSADDYRGLFGDIERATSAYKEMHNHKHNDPESTFPLFRLMTWIDPQFIDGWTIGSMLLADKYSATELKRAQDYLEEGLRANPDSIELLTQIGVLISSHKQDIPGGLSYFERAHKIIEQGSYGQSQLDAVELTFRWLTISYARLNRTDDLRATVEEGIKQFPDDQVLLRYAIQLGMHPVIPKS
ncbi:hypothetical protein BH11ARM1_BH11ARM1_13300 [soil metagenome]